MISIARPPGESARDELPSSKLCSAGIRRSDIAIYIGLAPTPSMWALGQLAGSTPPEPVASTG
jgi:hypothetical protein